MGFKNETYGNIHKLNKFNLSDRVKRIIFHVIKTFKGFSKCFWIQVNSPSYKKSTYEWFASLTVVFMKKTVLWRLQHMLWYRVSKSLRTLLRSSLPEPHWRDPTSTLKSCKEYTSLHGIILEECKFSIDTFYVTLTS